jgi:hypothetical protein
MKFKIKRDGLWAINPPNPGEYQLTKGMVVDDIPEHLIPEMFEKGYIEPAEKRKVDVKEELEEIASRHDKDLDDKDNYQAAKAALEEWGIANLNYDIDKRKSLEKIIPDLIAEYEKQNG